MKTSKNSPKAGNWAEDLQLIHTSHNFHLTELFVGIDELKISAAQKKNLRARPHGEGALRLVSKSWIKIDPRFIASCRRRIRRLVQRP